MKRLLPILLLGVCLLFWGEVAAQSKALTFATPRYDFATIAEDGGVVSHTFVCTNSSQKPIVILSVSGGCSCTTADFSREPILPGRQSSVTIHFDPMNQPAGTLARKVVVTTTEGNAFITFTGTITPRKKDVLEQYPIVLGDGVRIESNSHAFGYVEHGESIRSSIGVVNNSTKPITLELVPVASSGAMDIRYPKTLQPQQSGVIDFGYNIDSKSGIYGSLEEVFAIKVNKKESRYQLIISGIAIDKRETSSDKEWQKIQLSENFIKFGTLKRSSREVARALSISNVGIEPLKIRKIECNNAAFKVRLEGKTSITTDRSSRLLITLDPSRCEFGAVTGRITIVSNDPHYPTKSFRVSAIIEN